MSDVAKSASVLPETWDKSGPKKSPLPMLLILFAITGAVIGWIYYRSTHVVFDFSPPVRPVNNAPYIPTPQDVVDEMLKLAKVTADDVVYDLGCGDGRIVITAAKKFGCRAVGFEINPELVEKARGEAEKQGVNKLVSIEQRDVFTVDLRAASVVTIYLLPGMNKKLVPQLLQLKPGSRIVSHDFGIEGYVPDTTVKVRVAENSDHYLHLWERSLSETAKGSRQSAVGSKD